MAYAHHSFESRVCDRSVQDGPAAASEDLPGRDLGEIVELIERKLAWIGLHSMRITHVCVNDDRVEIELLARNNEDVCRLEVDRTTGAITRYDGLLPFAPP